MNEMVAENLSQSVVELAKNATVNISIDNTSIAWIATSIMVIYAIKTVAHHV